MAKCGASWLRTPRMDRRERELWRQALRATALGWTLALPIFAGVLIGYLLDRSFGTNYVFTLGFLVLGIATGFYNVFSSIHRVDEASRRHSKDNEEQNEAKGEARS